MWEQSLLAIQATQINSKVVSSFFASKLCSHRLALTGSLPQVPGILKLQRFIGATKRLLAML
ncbi:hypothetical protein PFLU4_10790 [Pseudomonas fluorescens]|nr:hypothetical protein PFLU4_10790 [Pseudomonas fluorescens]